MSVKYVVLPHQNGWESVRIVGSGIAMKKK